MRLVIDLFIKIQLLSLTSATNFDFSIDLNISNPIAANRVKRDGSTTLFPGADTCVLPKVTQDKNYTFKFPFKKETLGAKPGEIVPQFTIVTSRCNIGYTADYHEGRLNDSPLVSICTNGAWIPSYSKCKKICEKLHFPNSNMTCFQYFRGPKIPCTSILLEGATVIPSCQKQYHPDTKVNSRYVTCQSDGSWDKQFFKCSPDCGMTPSSRIELMVNGSREKRGESPWNLAIYSSVSSEKPNFICGGTLITTELVISAAHCFYDETLHQKQDPRLFRAIIGKTTRDFETRDYPTTITYTLKSIYFPDTTFTGDSTNYASDIVILHLSDRVTLSQDVLPACVYWDDKDRFNPGENVLGKLSGFGETENGKLASELLSANLPYISYAECLKRVSEDFRGSISVDKFCAGSENGAGARVGDSGGGLLFRDGENGLFYLRGVVSNKDLTSSSIATFTDITQYMPWITRTITNVDQSRLKDDTVAIFRPKIVLCDPRYQFTCSSRACIRLEQKCNGFRDCADGSDETLELCPRIVPVIEHHCPKQCSGDVQPFCATDGQKNVTFNNECLLHKFNCDNKTDFKRIINWKGSPCSDETAPAGEQTRPRPRPVPATHPPLTTDDEASRRKWRMNGFDPAAETVAYSYTRATVALPVYNKYDMGSAPFEHFGYFSNWAQHDGRADGRFDDASCGRNSDIRSIDFDAYTSAIYSSLAITGDNSSEAGRRVHESMEGLQQREPHQPIFHDLWADLRSWRNTNHDRYQNVILPQDFGPERSAGLLGGVRKLVRDKFTSLKLAFSVGGWTLSSPFHRLAARDEARRAFGRGVVRYMRLWPMFGGVDIDWEYPNGGGAPGVEYGPEDAANFPRLVAELRRQLNAAGMPDKRISVVLANSVEWVSRIDVKALHEAGANRFHVMAFNYFGSTWSTQLAHHANLRAAAGHDGGLSAQRVVEYLLSRGVPPSNVYVGYAAFSRNARSANVDAYAPLRGTFAPGSGTTVGTFASGSSEYYDVLANYAEERNASRHPLAGKNGFRLFTDTETDADFLYNPRSRLFMSIDTPRTVYQKGRYVREKKLGGMFCALMDVDRGLLANAALEGMGFTMKARKIDMRPFYQPGKTAA